MDEFQQEITKQLVEKTVGDAYKDIMQPTAKSLGSILNFLPGLIAAYLNKCQDWLINGKKSIELTGQAVQNKVAKIPEEKLSEPEPNIAIPAIQQLSYCYDCEELRNMYANLLVTSMNIDTKPSAHPAFVDIIKQLTPDEAKLLRKLFVAGYNPYPLIDLNLKKETGFVNIVKNFSDLSYGICEAPDNIVTYIDNLSRLGIIEISETQWLTDKNKYKELKEHPAIQKVIEELDIQKENINYSHKVFSITNFGTAFIDACVKE